MESNSKVTHKGILLILSSPSGGGKTAIKNGLLKKDPNVAVSVSATTRPKRPGEKEGNDYFFMDKKQFEKLFEKEAFLEDAHVFGHRYGTLKKEVKKLLEQGKDVVFDIDWQGMHQLRKNMSKDVVTIFILPPSLDALRERLYARKQDDEVVIESRMKQAMAEISHYSEYDYVIVNHNLEKSIKQAHVILSAERLKRSRQNGLLPLVDALV